MKPTTRAILDRLGTCQKHSLEQDPEFVAFLNESDSDGESSLPEASEASESSSRGAGSPKSSLPAHGVQNSSTQNHRLTSLALEHMAQKQSACQDLLERSRSVLAKSVVDGKAQSISKRQPFHRNSQSNSNSTEQPVRVTISMLGGAIAKLDVQCCTRVRALKQQIKTLGFPFVGNVYATMFLMHGATVLDDDMSICEIDAQHSLELQLLHVHDRKPIEMVRAVVRCRPVRLNGNGSRRAVCANSYCAVVLDSCERKCEKKVFTYDAVIDETFSQQQVFDVLAAPLLDELLDGYNATIMAYGHTGSGKSYTMLGPGPDCINGRTDEQGLLPRAYRYLFARMHGVPNTTWQVHCSFLEICNETVFDLLSPDCCKRDLKTDEHGLSYVADRYEVLVAGADEFEQLLLFGLQRCSQFPTEFAPSVNRVRDPARTHTMFTIKVQAFDNCGQSRTAELNMVEFMGSERNAVKAASEERMREAPQIGFSCSALGSVIASLTDGKSSFIPYRGSKMTRLLQGSLGGNCQTLFIGHVQSTDRYYDETLSTLRYAQRARLIKNRPELNVSMA